MLEAMTTPFDLVQPRGCCLAVSESGVLGMWSGRHGNRCLGGDRQPAGTCFCGCRMLWFVRKSRMSCGVHPVNRLFDSVRDAAEVPGLLGRMLVVAMAVGV